MAHNFSPQTVDKMAEALAPEFAKFINEKYGDDVMALMIEAANDFMAYTFGDGIDCDLAANIGCEMTGHVKLQAKV